MNFILFVCIKNKITCLNSQEKDSSKFLRRFSNSKSNCLNVFPQKTWGSFRRCIRTTKGEKQIDSGKAKSKGLHSVSTRKVQHIQNDKNRRNKTQTDTPLQCNQLGSNHNPLTNKLQSVKMNHRSINQKQWFRTKRGKMDRFAWQKSLLLVFQTMGAPNSQPLSIDSSSQRRPRKMGVK